ncbi:MAG: DUF6602 domain-containing protein [Candidatus Omnitrophota bacterium]|jgi:hypothetical protein|nr:hypothetical protein [Candidatus Omnitrophota bacterium]
MKKKNHIDIRKIFLGLQDQMHAKLSLNRRIICHPTTKGDASELEWVDMLSTYLPKRYQVDKAFVIDCKGNVSEQIDIVIFDRHYSPFLLRQNGATYVPAESVYAIIEVKPVLTNANIQYASKKASSVRRLERTTAKIVHAGGEIAKPKKPFEILAGILTIEGKCTAQMAKQLGNFKKDGFLNFGCSLNKESFWFKKDSGGNPILENSRQNEGLIFFFLNLLSELQQLGTVSAMDIQCYIEKFKKN